MYFSTIRFHIVNFIEVFEFLSFFSFFEKKLKIINFHSPRIYIEARKKDNFSFRFMKTVDAFYSRTNCFHRFRSYFNTHPSIHCVHGKIKRWRASWNVLNKNKIQFILCINNAVVVVVLLLICKKWRVAWNGLCKRKAVFQVERKRLPILKWPMRMCLHRIFFFAPFFFDDALTMLWR